MKHIFISFPAIALLVLGCAAPDRSVSSPSPSNQDIAQVSSPATGNVSCAQEIALDCANGVDGCLDGRTTAHVCIAAASERGSSCSQEIALECPAGEIDGCLVSPPVAAHHICVRR